MALVSASMTGRSASTRRREAFLTASSLASIRGTVEALLVILLTCGSLVVWSTIFSFMLIRTGPREGDDAILKARRITAGRLSMTSQSTAQLVMRRNTSV